MNNHVMRQRIADLADALGNLKKRMVLTGGAMVSFYLTDPQEQAPRVTEDVDIIVAVVSAVEFRECIESRLRGLGFVNASEKGDPICRWRKGDLISDIMPTLPSILGFSNLWYEQGFANAQDVHILNDCHWKMLSSVYFFATKIAAFMGRGKADPVLSQDFEDLVSLLNGRPE